MLLFIASPRDLAVSGVIYFKTSYVIVYLLYQFQKDQLMYFKTSYVIVYRNRKKEKGVRK